MIKDYIIAALLGAVGCLTGLVDLPVWEMEVCVACFMAGLHILQNCPDVPAEEEEPDHRDETFRVWLEQGTIGR